MAEHKEEEQPSLIVRWILELLSPGANRASLVLLNGTLVLIWILIIISICCHYYNLHVYIIGILTTCLVVFVNMWFLREDQQRHPQGRG